MNILESIDRLNGLIVTARPASIGEMRNLISSIREQYEADQQSHSQLAQDHAKLQKSKAEAEAKNNELVIKITAIERKRATPTIEVIDQSPMEPPDSLI